MGTLKPMTPLRPLIQASMKPPSPLLAPNKGALKPASPLHPKSAPKTPISRPQRRRRFQLRLGRRPQRRWRFQLGLGRRPQRRRWFQPLQMPASKGDTGFRRAGRLVYRTQMRYPWPVAGPGRATRGRPTLQTSSNHHDLNRLTKTPVTNVVNPSPKTAIISEKALRLTTFVTTDQKCAQKTPRIDDVCNNMHQSTPKNSTRETPVTPTGSRGTGPRCRRAVAGPGQTTSQRTEQHQRPGTTGVEGTGGSGGPGCDTRGRWRGLAGLRGDAQSHTSATRPHWCGGRRRDRRARAGFEAQRRTK